MNRKKKKDEQVATGRFAYAGLQRVFHEKARLGIMTSLISNDGSLTFTDLKELCGLSDGNLNRHLNALKEEGMIAVEREGSGRNAKSTCSLTAGGERAFADYLTELKRVLRDAQQS